MKSHSPKSSLSVLLDHVPGSRALVNSKAIRRSADAILGRFPITRRLPGSRVAYKIRDLENIYSAEEIFGRKVYEQAFVRPVETFVDLGANCGYFTCFAIHCANGRPLRGLAVEANPMLIPAIEDHLKINKADEVKALHGIVGSQTSNNGLGKIVLSDSHTVSSQSGVFPEVGKKQFGKEVEVRALKMFEEWTQAFGDSRIDLLKIDIEGSEGKFLAESPSILPLCDQVIIETHKWLVSPKDVKARLEESGLRHVVTLEDDKWLRVDLFRRDESK